MDTLLEYILNGATKFTPEVLIRILLFYMCFECISTIISAIFRAGGMR